MLLKNIETLDGLVYAQPLYLSGITMASTSGCPSATNIVIVATENNSIYAFDVTTGSSTRFSQCWKAQLNATGENAIPFTDLTGSVSECNNIVPQEGITGTPAVDLGVTPPALYAVSAVKTSTAWDFKLNIVKTDGGTVLSSRGSASTPENYLYVAGIQDTIKAYTLLSNGSFSVPATTNTTTPISYGYPGASPSISWNSAAQTNPGGTGIVWTIDTNGNYGKYNRKNGQSTPAGAATLYGYTAIPNGNTLTNVVDSDNLQGGLTHKGPGAVKFTVPTVAGGLVFVVGGEANPNYYNPGITPSSTVNCTPSATGGTCLGALYIYGLQ